MYHASSIKDESIATTSDTNDQPEHCLTTLQTDPPALTLFYDEKFMKANPVYPRERGNRRVQCKYMTMMMSLTEAAATNSTNQTMISTKYQYVWFVL